MISNIIRRTLLRFRVECLGNILFKKCGISNQPVAASAMIRVFPSLEHSGGACPHSARQFVGLLCSTYLCSRKKHNRAKPMSELLSALISIADSSEFRFARFNIVYEGAPLVLPESPPIVSGVSDMCPPVCPNVEETRNQLQSSGWKKYAHFFPTNAPAAFLQESGMLCFVQYCLPPKNRVCLL